MPATFSGLFRGEEQEGASSGGQWPVAGGQWAVDGEWVYPCGRGGNINVRPSSESRVNEKQTTTKLGNRVSAFFDSFRFIPLENKAISRALAGIE